MARGINNHAFFVFKLLFCFFLLLRLIALPF
uniref:Uncharacterized protein n=1 Tax=Anguilla anguilla TaxID=7936 RepID=A0A0E9S6S6_ANGAN